MYLNPQDKQENLGKLGPPTRALDTNSNLLWFSMLAKPFQANTTALQGDGLPAKDQALSTKDY